MTELRDRITMEHLDCNGQQHRLTVHPVVTTEDFLNAFRAFLHVCGFHADTVADMMKDDPSE